MAFGLGAPGLGALGLAPEAFWALTPRELAAALRGAALRAGDEGGGDAALAGRLGGDVWGGAMAPARADFAALVARFPDQLPV